MIEKTIEKYLSDCKGLKELSLRCLNTERWNGEVSLMIIDAAITSVGVNYFQVVIPKVKDFERNFIKTNIVNSLKSLSQFPYERAFSIWKNKRTWQVVREISLYLSNIADDDKTSLRTWAEKSSLENWKEDPIGRIKGVGLITYQYLRMMGGVDTVMPDKIVKGFINNILINTGKDRINNDMELIKFIDKLALKLKVTRVEICFLSWLYKNREKIPPDFIK